MFNEIGQKSFKWILGILAVATIFTAIARLFPHIPNFTPIGAMCLFAGAYIMNRKLAFVLPLACLFFTDALLHLNYLAGAREFAGFYEGMYFVYFAFAAMVGIGMLLKNKVNFTNTLLGAIGGSLVFFIVSNFGVWLTSTTMYLPKTMVSLIECYAMAVPFFWNSFAANLFYTALLFGGFEWAKRKALTPAVQ